MPQHVHAPTPLGEPHQSSPSPADIAIAATGWETAALLKLASVLRAHTSLDRTNEHSAVTEASLPYLKLMLVI